MPSLLPEGAVAVRFHSIGGWGAITTGKNLGAIIGDLNDLLYERDGLNDELRQSQGNHPRQRQPQVRLRKEGRAHQLLHGRRQRPHPRQLRSAPRHRRSLLRPQGLHPHQPARRHSARRQSWSGSRTKKASRPGSACPSGPASRSSTRTFASSRCPASTSPRRPPTAATSNSACRATPSSAPSSPSAACSTSSASRQEQYREVVYKQYVKKFGKLGDAVVASNMEVMTQGFEQVKEIKIGELSAADRSTLRGQALLPILELATARRYCSTGCRSTPDARGPGSAHTHQHRHQASTRSSAPASATTSPPLRSRPWASSPRPPATPPPST